MPSTDLAGLAPPGQKEGPIVNMKYGLLDNSNVRFIENASSIMLGLSQMLSGVSNLMNDENSLKSAAKDYRELSELKSRLSVNSNNPENLISELSKHLEFIKRHNPYLARIIASYGPIHQKQLQIIGQILNQLEDASKMSANLDFLTKSTESLANEDVKAKIKARLALIKRYSDEVSVLNFDLTDVNNWNLHFHDDISFYTETLEAYFKGSGKNNKRQFKPLNEFKDETLKKATQESKDIKMLYYVAGFTHQAQAQIEFIGRLIAFLQKDIDAKSGEWTRNVATKSFVDDIEKNAEAFKTQYRNVHFADILISNKTRIGEQPFAWIQLLEKMRTLLEQLIQKKNSAINTAQIYLYSLFKTRIEGLKVSLKRLSEETTELIKTQKDDAGLVNKIQGEIKKMEKVINELWKRRKKKFEAIKAQIESLNAKIIPQVQELTDRINIIPAALNIARNESKVIPLGKNANKIASSMGPNPDYRKFSLLSMLAWDVARLDEFTSAVSSGITQIKQTDEFSKHCDLVKLKESVKNVMNLYGELIAIINLLIIGINANEIGTRINNFMRENYG